MQRLTSNLLHLAAAVGLGLGLTLASGLSLAWAVNILSNGPFETFQSYNGEEWRGFPERYGQNWSLKVIDEDGLHFMDSETFGHFAAAVYGVLDNNYRLEGNFSQVFASRRGFNFVFSQTVPVEPGRDYALGGKMVTFWKGPGGPDIDHTKIFKRIGLDLSGGSDYTSPAIIWTPWDSLDNVWISPALAATAQTSRTTVYIQVDNRGGDVGASYLNSGHLDSFRFELAPMAELTLPAQAEPGSVEVRWDVDLPDPGYWSLWGYDVEYRQEPAGPWQVIQSHNSGAGRDTSFILQGQAGQSYTVRVRAWQQKGSGDAAITALPGVWQAKTMAVGQAAVGGTMNHTGLGLDGVTVRVNGTATSTQSSARQYALATGAGTFEIVADDLGSLVAPPPTEVTVPADGVASLDLTLRPTGPAQAIINNDFESDLAGWQASDSAAVAVSAAARHTGQASLLIAQPVDISQTNTISQMARPLLSFWYQSDREITVEILAEAGGSLAVDRSALLPAAGQWRFVTLPSTLDGVYSGALGVNFLYDGPAGASIFIDEVSLAAGPERIFLPMVVKE